MDGVFVTGLESAPGAAPFYRDADGRVTFDGQNERLVDFGHFFDERRGYRVYFKFRDSEVFNTFAPESLKAWAVGMRPANAEDRQLRSICLEQAEACRKLTLEWRRRGCPADGLSLEPEGRA